MKLSCLWILLPLAACAALIVLASCATMESIAGSYVMKAQARAAVPEAAHGEGTLITDDDLESLPPVVQRYLRYSGVVGKRRVSSFSVILEGRIRNGPGESWMPLVMRQYNRVDAPARIVYLESAKPPMAGVDSFLEASGRMHIKVMNLFTVADSRGPEMDISAFVTFLNDLVLCPVAYLSLPLSWRQLDEYRAELSMSYRGMTARAILSFDAEGRILDWQTDDRYADVKGRNVKDRWSTPFSGYGELAGLRIPSTGSGVHDYDGRPFVYVELDSISSLVFDAPGLPPRPNA